MPASDHNLNHLAGPQGDDSADGGEIERTRRLAERYRCAFVDLREQRIDAELYRSIPADLMFRYNFVPLELVAGRAEGDSKKQSLVIAVADPSRLPEREELSLLLGRKLVVKVAAAAQISDLLKRTEQSQRVLEQATEGFQALQVVHEEEDGEETISAERVTSDCGSSERTRGSICTRARFT